MIKQKILFWCLICFVVITFCLFVPFCKTEKTGNSHKLLNNQYNGIKESNIKRAGTVAKLDNGCLARYDVCSSNKNSYGDEFTYIGEGVIHSVGGVLYYSVGGEDQMSKTKHHFFVKGEKWEQTEARLDDGSIIEYDVCSLNKDEYDDDEFTYVGEGVIHSVGKVVQIGATTKYHFFCEK
jgi:hypothetical protein